MCGREEVGVIVGVLRPVEFFWEILGDVGRYAVEVGCEARECRRGSAIGKSVVSSDNAWENS